MKILYVEDEAAHVELTQRTLKDNLQHDFVLYHAETLQAALKIIETEPDIDLVLTDLGLPDGSGLDLLKKVREFPSPPAVVLVTGQGDQEAAVTALKAGAADYLVKQSDYLHRLPVVISNAVAQNRLARQQAALLEAEVKYQSLVEQIPAVVFLDTADETETTIYISPRIEELTGYTPDEWRADPNVWINNIHSEDRARIAEADNGSRLNKEDFQNEYRFIRRDGRVIWIKEDTNLICDKHGKPLYWQGILIDITKEKEDEATLQSERDFALQVLNNMGQGLTVVDKNSRFEYVNPAYASMLGQTAEELLGKTPTDFTAVSKHALLLEERSRGQQGVSLTYETTLIHKDSHEVPVVITGVPRQQNGGINGAIAVVTDLTVQKQTEQALERQVKELTALHAVATAEAESLSEDEIITKVTLAINQIYSEVCGILLLDATGRLLTPHPSYRGADISNWQNGYSITEGITGKSVATGKIIRIRDVTKEPGYIEIATKIISELCAPIRVNGRVIGVINVESKSADAFTEHDEGFLTTIASGLGTALEKLRLFNEEQRRAKELNTLYFATKSLTQSLEPTTIAEKLIAIINDLLDYDSASIHVVDDGGQFLTALAISRKSQDPSHFNMPVEKLIYKQRPLGIGIIDWVIQNGKSARTGNATNDARYLEVVKGVQSELCVPLIARGRAIGAINVETVVPNAYSEADENILSALANSAAIALENAKLYQEALRASERRAVLHRISQDIVRFTQDSEQIYKSIHEAAGQLMSCDVFLISLRNKSNDENIYPYAMENGTSYSLKNQPANEGLPGKVINSRGSIILANEKAIDSGEFPRFGSPKRVRSAVAVPMRIGNQTIGMISVQSYAPNSYGSEEQSLLEMLATYAAVALENVRLFEAEKQRRQEAETLRQAASAISSTLDPDEVVAEILAALKQVISFDSGSVFFHEGNLLRLAMAKGFPNSDTLRNLTFPADDQLFQIIKSTGRPLIIDDVSKDPRFKKWGISADIRGWMAVPLITRGHVIGYITLDSHQPGIYDESIGETAMAFAHQAAAATDNARLYDETQRRLRELEIINRVSMSLRLTQSVDEMLPILLNEALLVVNTLSGSIWLYDSSSNTVVQRIARGTDAKLLQRTLKPGEGIVGYVFTTGEKYISAEMKIDPLLSIGNKESMTPGLSGICIPIQSTAGPVGVLIAVVEKNRQIAEEFNLLTILAEITGNAIHRAELFTQSREQIHKLTTLRDIDAAIASSTDLRVTLNILMDHTLRHLRTDAVDIMLYHPELQSLTYLCSAGFNTPSPSRPLMRLGEGLAGQVVMKGGIEHIPDIRMSNEAKRDPMLIREGFVTYFGIPLIIKGQTKGVFEIFHRSSFAPPAEWLQFLQTLAGQAAIAIDNSQLFEHLQRSNQEVTQAYDTTLEGWARALELRDRETEGHTRRVTELTMELARSMRIPEDQLINIYRGVLLHDIGKMGVPDQILRKTGPLIDSEWHEMRKHPEYAYNLLKPIPYLRPALDIPYCHHEHWDGSGYPRGLKGEQIPLAARIFSIVDIWDALLSDRTYRKAWEEPRVIAYLKEISGTILDPKVVIEFFKMMGIQE